MGSEMTSEAETLGWKGKENPTPSPVSEALPTLEPVDISETILDEKEAAAAPQDSDISTIDPDPISLTDQTKPVGTTTIGTDEKIPDLKIRVALNHLSEQVSIAIDRGYSYDSIIDRMIREGAPIPPDETRMWVQAKYAEAAEAAKQEQTKAAEAGDAAIRDLQNISPEEIARLNAEAVERKHQDALDEQCRKYKQDDIGNGQRFAARYGDITKYCFTLNKWYLWVDTCWSEDEKGQVNELAKLTARAIYREAALVDPGDAPLHAKWATKSAGKKQLEYMLAEAQSDPLISILPADFDHVKRCKYLFNVLNGTLDLTPPGPVTFRGHRKEDLITRIAGVSYDKDAPCPMWKAHLNLIFGEKVALIDAFQEHAGYYLISGNPEKIFEIWWGESGNNGKTATQKVICQIMGTYARTTGASTFMQRRNNDADTPRSDLMALRGARLAISPETTKDTPLDVATVKGLTGGDQISLRDLHQKNTVYDPEFTPIMVTNHSPRILDTTDAIWNRIRRWPFTVQIPDEKIISDFDQRLAEEGSGILNWMIEGLERLQARGGKFDDPTELLESTRAYRADQDTVKKFIFEKCVVSASGIVGKATLYSEYDKWCTESDEIAISRKEFYKSFHPPEYKFVQNFHERSIKGIRLKTTPEQEEFQFKVDNGVL